MYIYIWQHLVAIFSYICQLCIFSTCLFQFFYFLSKFLHIICWLSVGDEHGYQSSSCTRQLGDQNWILALFPFFSRSSSFFPRILPLYGFIFPFFFTFSQVFPFFLRFFSQFFSDGFLKIFSFSSGFCSVFCWVCTTSPRSKHCSAAWHRWRSSNETPDRPRNE